MSLLLTPRIVKDISAREHYDHARWRVYPQDVTLFVQLAAGVPANTFGDWVQIIPIDTVPFSYDVIGLVIEQVSAATTYTVQMGYSLTAAPPGANFESGERRLRMQTIPIARASELLHVNGQDIPANASFWGRAKSATGVADTANISVVVTRHVEISAPAARWPAFPW